MQMIRDKNLYITLSSAEIRFYGGCPGAGSNSSNASEVDISTSPCYRPQRSWAKVMFLQASVILSTGGWGCLPQCMLGYHNPPRADPPRPDTPPGADPPGADTPLT